MPQRARRVTNRVKRKRPSASARGYDRRWQTASKAFLDENPLCQACTLAGRTTAAEVVDHVTPHRGDKVLFWRRSNWQSLCKTCHDEKTRRGE